MVSRKHLIVRRIPEGIIVENLSETNPFLLNDEEIDDQLRVLQNDDIRIGNETLRYYEDSSKEHICRRSEETEEPIRNQKKGN